MATSSPTADKARFDEHSFKRFCEIVYDSSGILLGEKKRSLVEARLGKRLRELGLARLKDYLPRLAGKEGRAEMVQMLDLISTNVTSFYREADHFRQLGEIIDGWASSGQKKLRIWCAAASSGEEPYTLAITALEASRGRIPDLKILGTDISTRVLKKCVAGVYEEAKVAPVPEKLKQEYFEAGVAPGGQRIYSVRENMRRILLFRRMNLVETPYPLKGPIDVIFCRNVMIYFDNRTRARLLAEMERVLRPGGYLMVGHSESLAGRLCNLERAAPSTYRKRDS